MYSLTFAPMYIAKPAYNVPVPPDVKRMETAGVLPIGPSSGSFGTVPELLFEKKGLILALQQLLVSFHT